MDPMSMFGGVKVIFEKKKMATQKVHTFEGWPMIGQRPKLFNFRGDDMKL